VISATGERSLAGIVAAHPLAETLHTAMCSPTVLDRRSVCARAFAQRFHWAEVANRLKNMYDSVLHHPAPPVPGSLRPARQV